MMTVRQLKAELKGYDDDMLVTIRYEGPGGWTVSEAPVSDLYEGEGRLDPYIVLRAP